MQSKEAQALIDKYANMQQDVFDILIKQLQQTSMSEITANNVLQWQLEALSKVGALTKQVIRTVAKVNKTTPEDVEHLVSQLGLQAVSDVQNEIKQHTNLKGNLTPDISAMIESYAKPMQQSLAKTVNAGMLDRNTKTNAAAQVYKDIVNKTTLEVMGGLKTHEQAVRDNIYRWVDKGIPTKLTDKSGKGWSVEGYARTVVTTNTRQAFNELRKETMSVNNVHLAKMSWHACARPACAPIQGHVVSSLPPTDPRYDPKYPSIFDHGYGEPSGTLGINCGHIFTPWDPDVNIDRQDKDMPTPEEAVKQGKIQQKQRQQERAIRQTKKLIDAAEKLGDGDKVASLKKRLARQQGKLRGLVKEHSFLSRDYKRERIFNKPEQYKVLPRYVKPKPKKPTFAKITAPTKVRPLEDFANRVKVTGIKPDVLEEVQKAFTKNFENMDIPKIGKIEAVTERSAMGKMVFQGGGIASYGYTSDTMYLNKTQLSSMKKLKATVEEQKKSADYILKQRENLTGEQRKVADQLAKAGRENVDPSPQGIISHELGHSLHYHDFARNHKELNQKIMGGNWKDYASKLSLYANQNYAEFFAESYAAYMANERSKVLPDLLKYFDSIRKEKK